MNWSVSVTFKYVSVHQNIVKIISRSQSFLDRRAMQLFGKHTYIAVSIALTETKHRSCVCGSFRKTAVSPESISFETHNCRWEFSCSETLERVVRRRVTETCTIPRFSVPQYPKQIQINQQQNNKKKENQTTHKLIRWDDVKEEFKWNGMKIWIINLLKVLITK